MRRGTTPTLRVTVDADVTAMHIYLALKCGRNAIVRENDTLDVALDESGDEPKTVITCRLSQSETLSMRAGERCEVQLRAVTDEGATALASNIGSIPVGRILQDGELDG